MTDDQAMSADGGGSDQDQGQPPVLWSSTGRTIAVGLVVVVVLLGGATLLLNQNSGLSSTDLPPNVGDLLEPNASAGDDDPAGGLGLSDAVEVLPEFDLIEFGGDAAVPVSSFLGGRPLVLNFWATWCAPCVAEMPDFQEVHEAGADAFRLVGVNTMDASINAEPFVEELGITYDLAVDQTGEYFQQTGGFGMPTTLFVRPDGSVAYRHTGPLTTSAMTDLLSEHLGVDVQV